MFELNTAINQCLYLWITTQESKWKSIEMNACGSCGPDQDHDSIQSQLVKSEPCHNKPTIASHGGLSNHLNQTYFGKKTHPLVKLTKNERRRRRILTGPDQAMLSATNSDGPLHMILKIIHKPNILSSFVSQCQQNIFA